MDPFNPARLLGDGPGGQPEVREANELGPPRSLLFADVVPVPKRLLSAWKDDLNEVEFAVGLTMIGETWAVGRTAARCPMAKLTGWWEALDRNVTGFEIETALAQMVEQGTLLAVSPAGGPGSEQTPEYAVNRHWPELVER